MKIELPKELLEDESFEELKKPRENTFEPFNIEVKIAELTQQASAKTDSDERVEFLTPEVEALKSNTPTWFHVWLDSKGNICHQFEHDEMGDELIKKFHLVRFPKLTEGAVYEQQKGAWRYFVKNEMTFLSEKEALTQLQLWGYYDSKYIAQVSRYIKQKTYDASFSNTTPFDKSKPELVPFKNGTYNILTGEMKNHDPEDYILTSYDYSLDMSGKPTPATNKFFEDFFGSSALFMKQFIGYTFYRSHKPTQEMVFLKGDGGEGKSSFLSMLVDNYVTKENRTALTPQSLTEDKFTTVELLGKTLNVSGDIESDYLSQSGLIKCLTGGDAVKAEYKGTQSFTFESYAKHIFSMNEFFHFKDLSGGFADRLAVIPITIGDQRSPGANFWENHDLEKIKGEASAFVYLCIKEFRKIFNGKRAQFTKSKEMEALKREWLFDNDRIAQFLFEGCELKVGDPRGEIASTVYLELKAFCSINGYGAKSAQELTKYLAKRNIPRKKTSLGFDDGGSQKERYLGLKLVVTFRNEFNDLST